MMTPNAISKPPVTETKSGNSPSMRLWTLNARTSSKHLRLATRLGEISWRDLVRVVKANNPEIDNPKILMLHLLHC